MNGIIVSVRGILKKLMGELKNCKKDYDFLMTIKEEERDDNYIVAFKSVKERYDDLMMTVELLQERLKSLD